MLLRIDKPQWLTTQYMAILILSLFNITSAGPRGDKGVWPYNIAKRGVYIGDDAETQFSFPKNSRKTKVVLTSDTFHIFTFPRLFRFLFQFPTFFYFFP